MTNEICVPASAVAAGGGEGGDPVAPGVGDMVETTISGKVSRVEGDQVYFTPETANGEPLAKPEGMESAEEDDKTYLDRMSKENEKGGLL